MAKLLTISEITGQVKQNLEESFSDVTVVGEISNFKDHISGHWYFSLKDSNAQINCTMWRGVNSYVFFTPQNGMKIIATGRITVYPPRGTYQLDVRSMKVAGEGELQAAFERLKAKLSAEGLFEVDYKKVITRFPNKIGIISGAGSAAIEDMITTAKRRYPLVELDFIPTKVQGEQAAEDIAKGIKYFNQLNQVDTIIIGRGGGSLEDLWAFNEEIVAREIFASTIPIISGVGHEIDFTISDFVADLRAATPTAAMELATPNKDEIFAFINDFSYTSTNNIDRNIESSKQKVEQILKSYGFRTPEDLIKNRQQYLDNLLYKVDVNVQKLLQNSKNRLAVCGATIKSKNIDGILKRGFTIVEQDNHYIERAEQLELNKKIKIKFYDKEVELN